MASILPFGILVPLHDFEQLTMEVHTVPGVKTFNVHLCLDFRYALWYVRTYLVVPHPPTDL
jgi:hypothetical protein